MILSTTLGASVTPLNEAYCASHGWNNQATSLGKLDRSWW